MLFLLVCLLVLFCLVVIVRFRQKNHQTVLLLCIFVSFVVTVVTYILFISQDVAHYRTFLRYYLISTDVFRYVSSKSLSQSLFARTLNISSILFLAFNMLFVFSFSRRTPPKKQVRMLLPLFTVLLIEWFIYDPQTYVLLYRFLYPDYVSARGILALQSTVHSATNAINIVLLMGCIAGMFLHFYHSPKIRYIRNRTFSITISYVLLVCAYLFLFSSLPTPLVKYSKIASMTRFVSLPLYGNHQIYYVFPIVILLLLALALFTMYRHNTLLVDMNNKSLAISQKIDASSVTTRSFCHYMKNELLALASEISDLEATDENREGIASLLEHCDQLSERLNYIHRNMSKSVMCLIGTNPKDLLEEGLAAVTARKGFANITLDLNIPRGLPEILVDPEYFRQALENIIENALEALEASSRQDKVLTLEIQYNVQWVILIIRDNGPGIPEKDITNIFTPLFSSKPMRSNWGVGLSLSYKIVRACNGNINVVSKPGIGTTFEILIPNLYTA